jgi:hypothetical protein
LVLKDRASRPVVVMGEAAGGPEELLGRGLNALAEIRRLWSLLDRIYAEEGVTFGTDPRLFLVAHRFSDALHGASEMLGTMGIELVEAREMTIDGTKRLVIVKIGAGTAGGPSENGGAAGRATGARARVGAERAEVHADEARKKA